MYDSSHMLLEKQVSNINQKESSELVLLDGKALQYPHHHPNL